MPQYKSCLAATHPFQCPCWRVGPDSKHFHLVKTLSDSGIALYLSGIQHEHNQESTSKIDYAMVIYNTISCDFRTDNILKELEQFKTRCPKCLNVIECAQAILNYYDCIKKKYILAICPDCLAMRRKKLSCVQCDNLTQKFQAWKRRHLEGISVPGDSKLWLKQIDEAVQDMKEPYTTKKPMFTEKYLYSVDKDMKRPSHEMGIVLKSTPSKALSYTDLGDTQHLFVNKMKYGQEQVKELPAKASDNLYPMYATSANGKPLLRKKIDRKPISDQSLAKIRDKDSIEISKSGQLLSKETKKYHEQGTSTSDDSDTVNVDEKKKTQTKNMEKKTSSKLKNMKSTDPGPQSSIDIELVKHRKLRKHHSLDTFLTSIDKKEKKAKKNFTYLFPEEFKRKSKSSHNLKTDDKTKSKMQSKPEVNQDRYDKKKIAMRDSKKGQSSVESIPDDTQKQKTKSVKEDKAKFKSESELDDKDDRIGSKKSKTKDKQYNKEDDQSVKRATAQYDGKKRRNENDTTKNKQGIYDRKRTEKLPGYQTDKKGQIPDIRGDEYGSKKGHDIAKPKYSKRTEIGKSGASKNMELGSNLVQSLKPSKRSKREDENESKLVNVIGVSKGKKKSDVKQEGSSKAYKRDINEGEQESKHALVAKRGKGNRDFDSKQDHDDGVDKKEKGKVKANGKKHVDLGQGKGDGDKRQKGIKGKNMDGEGERETRGKGESKIQKSDDRAKKGDTRLERQEGKAGADEKNNLIKKHDTGKLKDNKEGNLDGSTKTGDKGKSKPQTGESELLLKQIRAQRSALNNKIFGLVSVKQNVTKKQRNPPTDVIKLLKKKFKAKATDSYANLKFAEELCDEPPESVHEFIVGEIITHVKPVPKEENDSGLTPLLFNTTIKDDNYDVEKVQYGKIPPGRLIADKDETAGITHYALSDRQFIDMGWTMLPTEKVVRKMNVYRMRPAHPEFNWFERNKNKQTLLYDTGEKMTDFDEDGHVRWFYRNGGLALDYYEAEVQTMDFPEVNAQQRLVVYGNGEADQRGRPRPVAVLAMFDYIGNGVVLDNAGKIRLKYNQTEGVIMDKSLGPLSHWKWHTLNDPPVLQQVMIDTHLSHKDPEILRMGGKNENAPRSDNEDMLAIEFDNFIKEKSKKLAQAFKPFQIKMKALKINEYFSLRILDQASVYLIYRDGTTNIKLNIGMILDHKEIVDTDTAELGDVLNNIERFPARTISLEGIQRSVAHAHRVEASRVGLERRLHPPVPVASADRLAAAISKPPRTHLRTMPTTATNYGTYFSHKKNSCPNLNYETGIVKY